jgi:TRAP-type uncharacterized transport system substrate-binding protein
MKGNPGVFHKTVRQGGYATVDKDVDAIAITRTSRHGHFSGERVYQILKALFANKGELASVWKGANNLLPALSVGQLTPAP